MKIIQIFSFFCFIAMCYYAFLLPLQTLYVGFPFALLTVLYAVPFFGGFEKNLRMIGFLKIMVVGLVWAGFTVLVPYYHEANAISYPAFLLFIQRFFIVFNA